MQKDYVLGAIHSQRRYITFSRHELFPKTIKKTHRIYARENSARNRRISKMHYIYYWLSIA